MPIAYTNSQDEERDKVVAVITGKHQIGADLGSSYFLL